MWASSDHGPSDPPDGPWPKTATVQVAFCVKDSFYDECTGREPITDQERQAALAKLGAFEGVSEVTAPQGGPTAVAMLADRGDFPRLKSELEGLNGVAGIVATPSLFWTGKADVRIELCGPKMSIMECGTGGSRPSASEEEKEAIYQWLRKVPDVSVVYLADRDFVAEEARAYLGDEMSGEWQELVDDPNERFHVKLGPMTHAERKQAADRVIEMIGDLPGVKSAKRVSF